MDLRHLRYFVAVAEEEHFGRAATRLHIVQPALSMQIKALETEMGGELFTRTTRQVRLTEAGRVFLPEALRILAQVGHAASLVRSSLSGEIGRVRVGFVGNAVLSGVLTKHLRRFCRKHPKAEIILAEASPPNLRNALLESEIDVAYVSHGAAQLEALVEIPVLSGQLGAFLFADHPLASRSTLTSAALDAERLLLYGTPNDGRLQELAEQGYTPSNVLYFSSTLAVLAAAAAGLGVALGPAELQKLAVPGLAYRPVSDLRKEVPLSLLHRAGETSGAVLSFARLARKPRARDYSTGRPRQASSGTVFK